ncbi:polyphosphate kinase 2 family protein [Methylobacterium sp. SD274]|uniref:polyphosphate kinase 2 family protein n=1 Tax=Methylobacterium sp. SD274 TaxID=2782009 RepID=UPI001A96AA75|nr:polyphosphate kinase 2 family protein [Methylobacterium sp. SD274]MBO1020690.1 polyphosphate kinase 2 family protein [Methylobacterium sp. SD274]
MSKKRGKRHSGQSDDMGRHKPKPPARRPESDKPPSSAAWARSAMRYPDRASPIDTASIASCAAAGIVTVQPGEALDLAAIDADADGGLDKEASKQALLVEHGRIQALQERLYAEHRRSLLVVLQAIDTGGKDGTIRSVFEGVNPQGCRVWSFKVPSAEERDHDFLWRYHAKVPGRGMIGVFNRSHYEDVLVVRVKSLEPEDVWRPRYDLINDFERMLTLSGVTVLKFFLHISKDEQKERLEARIADPEKHWKFDAADLVERQSWDAYQSAFTDALSRCSTPHAPWRVVPANRKWYRNLLVARTIANTLEAMDPRYPDAQPGIAELTVPD